MVEQSLVCSSIKLENTSAAKCHKQEHTL